MLCGKCGASVPDGYEFCMECGSKIEANEQTTDVPAEMIADATLAKGNKKILFSVIGVVAIAVIVIAFLFGMKDAPEKNGYFANIPWGTDIETVQKMVDEAFDCESYVGEDGVLAVIEDYDGMEGVTANSIFFCRDEGALNEVGITFSADDDSEYDGDEIVEEIVTKYDKLYGKSDRDSTYVWETKNSTITLSFLPSTLNSFNSEDIIMLHFKQ